MRKQDGRNEEEIRQKDGIRKTPKRRREKEGSRKRKRGNTRSNERRHRRSDERRKTRKEINGNNKKTRERTWLTMPSLRNKAIADKFRGLRRESYPCR